MIIFQVYLVSTKDTNLIHSLDNYNLDSSYGLVVCFIFLLKSSKNQGTVNCEMEIAWEGRDQKTSKS